MVVVEAVKMETMVVADGGKVLHGGGGGAGEGEQFGLVKASVFKLSLLTIE